MLSVSLIHPRDRSVRALTNNSSFVPTAGMKNHCFCVLLAVVAEHKTKHLYSRLLDALESSDYDNTEEFYEADDNVRNLDTSNIREDSDFRKTKIVLASHGTVVSD